MKIGDLVCVRHNGLDRLAIIIDKRIEYVTPYGSPVGDFFYSKWKKGEEIIMFKCLWTDTNTTTWIKERLIKTIN
jgi:hypothetical protein